ncbi:hypothetical protein THERMOS_491 [Bathymodiolus thermophilus thioautotrophic gill symbiont]|uniref:Uncharacterized protein n=1 Tax=Bathymodiolus thermophilus thioautotrophic gill symbiont TaxID=2360 RepID=A0A8H9CF24_9GAMM|nr:hypothetical protein THERMOS_491 [Bathymodiolus thermophilus thioautotrophic gill symbiont]
MRSALLFSKKTNKDGVKDNESLEKIVMNAVTKATK